MSETRIECSRRLPVDAIYVGCAQGLCPTCGEFVPLDSEGRAIRHFGAGASVSSKKETQ